MKDFNLQSRTLKGERNLLKTVLTPFLGPREPVCLRQALMLLPPCRQHTRGKFRSPPAGAGGQHGLRAPAASVVRLAAATGDKEGPTSAGASEGEASGGPTTRQSPSPDEALATGHLSSLLGDRTGRREDGLGPWEGRRGLAGSEETQHGRSTDGARPPRRPSRLDRRRGSFTMLAQGRLGAGARGTPSIQNCARRQ